MSLQIERVPLEGHPLASAYVADFSSVGAFYPAGSPSELDSYRRVMERIRHTPAPQRQALSGQFPDLSPAARKRLDEVLHNDGVFVATGQQAGLFVSPLLTLYKALTAARLADQLQEALGVPAMPLFSIASEDHDWNEVDHTHVIDLENRLRCIVVAGPMSEGGARPPVERITLGAEIEAALDELSQSTPETEFKEAVLRPLRDAYRPGRGFADAFQRALGHLLRTHRFLLVRTAHAYVKQASSELLWQEWQRRHEVEARLLQRVAAIEAAGFQPQVPVTAGVTNLFIEGALGRDRVLMSGDGLRLRRSGEQYEASDLRAMLEREPGRVSPGALLRPVTEARAFPVVAYVAGPAEIAYLAQSQVLFELHGAAAPVVVPRAAFQLIEPKVIRVLNKYGIEPEQLGGETASAIHRLLKERTPPQLRESLEGLRRELSTAIDRVEEAALEFDPGSKSAVGSGRRAILDGVEQLEAKLQARVNQKHEVMRRQLEKAAVNLYPAGKPQERMLNPYPYLVRYGESVLDQLYQRVRTPLD